jgi:photosystem II stability/assembly factor-like uncharacterized protein
LAIDPLNSSVIYLGSDSNAGLFKSTDGGVNWTQLTGGAPSGAITSMAIHPTNSNIIYVGTAFGAYKSTNGGASWSTINNGLTVPYITCLLIDPSNTDIIMPALRIPKDMGYSNPLTVAAPGKITAAG